VLVVIADPHLRQTVGWILDDLGLAHTDVPNWRRAVLATDAGPALAICDIDDIGKDAVAGVQANLHSERRTSQHTHRLEAMRLMRPF
jgi:hypothetical protein